MAIHPPDSAPDLLANLPRLDTAIRLKADLIHKIAASPMREWQQHFTNFVAALTEAGVQEKTALLVLLADVRQELRAFMGLAKAGESDVVELFDGRTGSDPSIAQILARFQHVVANDLLVSAGSVITTPDVVMQAMRFIDMHYAQPITVTRVAAHVGQSSKHFGTVFRRHAGMTVHEYLIRVRLRQAMQLIRDGEKIEAVGLLVGYRSKKNFYWHFKSHTGLTPSAYRTALSNSSPTRKQAAR